MTNSALAERLIDDHEFAFCSPNVTRWCSQSTKVRLSDTFGESVGVWTIDYSGVVRVYTILLMHAHTNPGCSPSTILIVKSPKSGVDPAKLTGPSRPSKRS